MRWDRVQGMYRVYESGGDPPAQTSSTTVNQLYSPEEAARRARLMQEAEGIYANTKGLAQGLAPGGPSADTLRAQEMLRGLATGPESPFTSMIQGLQGATEFGLNAAQNPTGTPGFQDVLNTTTRKVTESFEGPSGPFAQIRSGFTGSSSGGSGTREGIAMGMAGRDYLNTIGDVTGQLTQGAYNKGLDTMSRTMAMTPQTLSSMMMPSGLIGGIGQQTEAYDEADRMWQLNAPWMALQPYSNAVMGMGSPGTQSTSTQPGPQGNPMAPIGSAMMGGSLAAMMGFNPIVGAGAGLMLSLFD